MLPPSGAKVVFDLSSVGSCCGVEKFGGLRTFADVAVVAGVFPNKGFVGTSDFVTG